MSIDLRLGDWRTALADVEMVDAVITDPPYSARTHAGQNATRNDGQRATSIDYASWSPADVAEFVGAWSPRTRGWMACMTDSELAPAWRAAFEHAGRCSFAPVPCVIRGMTVRQLGDGPSSWCVWLMVARPRTKAAAAWGTLPGAYTGPSADVFVTGGKPEWLMRAVVADYSRAGDLVCDPCGGGATTLIAAASEGRRAVGAEVDQVTHAKALARIARGYTPSLFAEAV